MQTFEIYEIKDLGTLFRKARMDKGISQEQVAEETHIGNSAISRLENGHIDMSFSKLLYLVSYYDLDLKFAAVKEVDLQCGTLKTGPKRQ